MKKIMKKQNIKFLYRMTDYFLLVGLIFALMAGSAYCLTLSISPTISLEEGELRVPYFSQEIARNLFP
jgi:hypothetical protein